MQLIVDYAFDEHETLKACSVVSLQWANASRLHLFNEVTLANAQSLPTLIDLLQFPFSTISRSIRKLAIEAGRGFDRDQGRNARCI